MKKSVIHLFLPFFLLAGACSTVYSQLKLGQGQTFGVTLQLKTTVAQQAMGQSIDLNIDGRGEDSYKVTNATEDNITLRHTMQRINFSFDGMGQKKAVDSNNEKDMNGQFGKPVKEMLDKKYDMIIDPAGKVLMVQPEKIELTKMDERMAIITSLLKDVWEIVQPPKKGGPSLFAVLPSTGTVKGARWADTVINASITGITNYSISDINDSTIVVDVLGNSITTSKAEMMGSETTTVMNNKITGKMIVDKATGILREKNLVTESNGTTETSFGSLPVTSRSTVIIQVKEIK